MTVFFTILVMANEVGVCYLAVGTGVGASIPTDAALRGAGPTTKQQLQSARRMVAQALGSTGRRYWRRDDLGPEDIVVCDLVCEALERLSTLLRGPPGITAKDALALAPESIRTEVALLANLASAPRPRAQPASRMNADAKEFTTPLQLRLAEFLPQVGSAGDDAVVVTETMLTSELTVEHESSMQVGTELNQIVPAAEIRRQEAREVTGDAEIGQVVETLTPMVNYSKLALLASSWSGEISRPITITSSWNRRSSLLSLL